MKKVILLCAFMLGSGIGLSSVALGAHGDPGDSPLCLGCTTVYNQCLADPTRTQASCQYFYGICIREYCGP